jgi:uncharacterized protein YndB with AHSA1/START domain
MKTLDYTIDINAGRQKVWDTMLQRETYKQWTEVSWPGSDYEGQWEQGQQLRFGSPEQGGTLAEVTELKPYEYVRAEHVAIINPDGSEDRDSDMAKGWTGTIEAYTFTEKNGQTELKVHMEIYPEWEQMFNEGWPNALAKLKELCEK